MSENGNKEYGNLPGEAQENVNSMENKKLPADALESTAGGAEVIAKSDIDGMDNRNMNMRPPLASAADLQGAATGKGSGFYHSVCGSKLSFQQITGVYYCTVCNKQVPFGEVVKK